MVTAAVPGQLGRVTKTGQKNFALSFHVSPFLFANMV